MEHNRINANFGPESMVSGEIPGRVNVVEPHETLSVGPEREHGLTRTGTRLCPASGTTARQAQEQVERQVDRVDRIDRIDLGGTEENWRVATENAHLCDRFMDLRRAGYSLRMAARMVGRSAACFSGPDSMLARYERGGVAALLPSRKNCGRPPEFEVPDWFVPAARHFYMLTNRSKYAGSVPEAIRRVISLPSVPVGWKEQDKKCLLKALGLDELPTCPVALREEILARQKAGQDLVPERLTKLILVRGATVRAFRSNKDAGLEYLCAPGGLRLVKNAQTGEVRLGRAGDVWEADDSTINFPVCVPWTIGGDACSDRYGVRVGRFQWLVAVDAGTNFALGYSYTARPRSSYRAEDILSLFRLLTRAFGVPRRWRLERGVWQSNRVVEAIKLMNSDYDPVYSPHAKVMIEGLFNVLWTKLAVQFPRSQVGRFQGENKDANDLLTACRNGHRDPRNHFPMLADALKAFNETLAEKNNTPIQTEGHGRWVPAERWLSTGGDQLRKLDPASEWLFSPWCREWPIKGMLVGGRVRMFEEMSIPFDFSAEWMPQYHGARVKVYFDPSAPSCVAAVVLAEKFGTRNAGELLGMARQVNDTANYVRAFMGYGDADEGAGRLARQQAAAALRREVRAIVPGTRGGVHAHAESEERDGLATVTRVEQVPSGNVDTDKQGPARTSTDTADRADRIDNDDFSRRLEEAAAAEKDLLIY